MEPKAISCFSLAPTTVALWLWHPYDRAQDCEFQAVGLCVPAEAECKNTCVLRFGCTLNIPILLIRVPLLAECLVAQI